MYLPALVGAAVVGLAVTGAAVVGFAVVGLAVDGAAVVGLAVVGLAVVGASVGAGVGTLVLVSSITKEPSLAMKLASPLLVIAAVVLLLPLSSLRAPTASFTSCPKLTLPVTGPCRPAIKCLFTNVIA
jgi:hypothetical protein